MPRDHARIRTDMWADDHWRGLSPGAQWLYLLVLSSPSLNHAGVADWRPSRIAKLARTLTADAVRKYADELARERFIITDDETEEMLVRSFLRHDGVLVNPNLWKSVGTAFADVYSPALKAAVATECAKLRAEFPDGFPTARGDGRVNPWTSKHLQTLLKSGSDTPSDRGSDTPSTQGVTAPPAPPPGLSTPTPTPRNASHSSARAKSKSREVQLSKGWAPTAEHIERARVLGVDVVSEAENFRLHAEAHERRAVNWNAAFTMWLKKAKPSNGQPVARSEDIRDGFVFRQGKPVIGGPGGMTRAQYDAWAEAERAKAVRRG